MRKITLFMCLLAMSFGSAQTVLEDFEGTPSLSITNGLGGVSVTADPVDATNQVAEIISSAAGDPWQQADLLLQTYRADLSTTNTISVDVYATQDFNMMLKVEDVDGGGATTSGAQQSYVSGSGWQTLTFTYDSSVDNLGIANGEYRKVSFFPNWAGNGSGTNGVNPDWNNPTDFTIYVDNVTAVAGTEIVSCSDGVQNGDETDVDCGGSCAPCEALPTEILEDFDGATAPTIATANGGLSATIVADPAGANGNVLEFITSDAAVAWQQAELTLQDKYVDLSPNVTNSMTIDVYSTEPIDVLIRVTGGINTTTGAAIADSAADGIHGGTGWETVEFDFSDGETQDGLATPTGAYNKIYLFNLWNADDSGSGPGAWTCAGEGTCPSKTLYFDNISGVLGNPPVAGCTDPTAINYNPDATIEGDCVYPPTVAAPTPPARNADDVVALFSDAYPGSTDTGYGQVDVFGVRSDENIGGDNFYYCESGFQYNYYAGGGSVDLSGMTHLHFDYFINNVPTGAVIGIQLIDDNNNNFYQPNLSTGALGEWVSVDVPLADFTNAAGGTDYSAVKLVQANIINFNASSPAWIDNLYFYREASASTSDFNTVKFNVYPNPSNDNWNVSGNTEITKVSVFDILGKEVITLTPNRNEAIIEASSLGTGIYFAKIEGVKGNKTVKLIRR